MANLFLPKIASWFRLDEHVRRLTSRVETLEDAPAPTGLPYKVYTALLTQSGTNAPVATVLENTLGVVTFTRDTVGGYRANLTGGFITGKTIYNVVVPEQSLGDGFKAAISVTNGVTGLSVNSLPFITYQDTTDNVKDGVLTGTAYIEIYVYN